MKCPVCAMQHPLPEPLRRKPHLPCNRCRPRRGNNPTHKRRSPTTISGTATTTNMATTATVTRARNRCGKNCLIDAPAANGRYLTHQNPSQAAMTIKTWPGIILLA